MALCLYHPEFGYYRQGVERTGVRGDYFTSPDLHPVFARLVARQAAEMWEVLRRPARFTWVEMGAGSGRFARDFVVGARRQLPEFAAALEYVAVEPSARQPVGWLARLREGGAEGAVRVLNSLEEVEPLTGCFFSNELVDAFPVSVVTRARGQLEEVYVTAEGDDLRETLGPLSDPAIAACVAPYANQLEEGHRIEVNREAVQWVRTMSEKLVRGFVVTIDYGDLAERLYAEARPRGTSLAYHRHTVSEDFFSAPGECDLTAHVNFSALIDAGKGSGLHPTGFTTQEAFLMAWGEKNEFADLYDPGEDEVERLQARLKLKRLLFPGGMGNVFKVLIQHRGIAQPVLSGLKYCRG